MRNLKVLKIDSYEQRILVNALNRMRNDLKAENTTTDGIDELLLKVIDAPGRRGMFFESCK